MRRRLVLIFMIFLVLLFSWSEQYALKEPKADSSRVALVIGNSNYKFPISKLNNAANDAQAIVGTLQGLGFEVISILDATKGMILNKIREWEIGIKNASVAMFYYVGHGMQVEGVNYLIPIGANIEVANEIKFEGVDISIVLAKMKEAGCGTNIVVLDACRNKPFDFDIFDTGFAEVKDLPKNSIIVYSTRAGAPAVDNDSFSTFFNSHLRDLSYLEIKDFLRSVTNSVSDNTGGKQIPLPMGTLERDFYFDENRNLVYANQGPIFINAETFILTSSPGIHQPNFIKGIIVRRGFFERTWNPKKTFKNNFEEKYVKKKKITLIIDHKTNLMWYESESGTMTHKEAKEWIEKMKKEKFAEFDDWRLPTVEEAVSLLEETGNPKSQILYIDNKFSAQHKRIWTCDKVAKDKEGNFGDYFDLYWVVDFESGIIARFDGESAISVRPVRSIN